MIKAEFQGKFLPLNILTKKKKLNKISMQLKSQVKRNKTVPRRKKGHNKYKDRDQLNRELRAIKYLMKIKASL